MSLRSGKNYLKEYEQQDEAEVQVEPDVSPHDGATLDQSKPADQPSPEGSNRHLHAARGPSNSYSFNPLAHTFQPTNKSKVEPEGTQGFANYLIRKELVSTGLLQFDDKPENYWAWKASFVSATKDLNLSAREEQDLLTKWLGPKSSEQAKRIRAVHTLNPAAGVKMIWERLEESYGSSEAIEDALLRKIEEFPKLTNKDGDRLRELGDILLELNCAKSDGTLPGLAYLDTARGVAVKCVECDSPKHISALHPGPTPVPKTDTSQSPATEEQPESPPAVVSKCTEVCGQSESPRSCSKICLVKAYPEGQKDRALNMYAVIDEQSNRSLAKTEFFNLFEIKTTPAPYTLKTCSGKAETTGRRAVDFIIESMDGKTNIKLPPLIECDSVPDDRSEIPSPEIAQHHPHLLPIANKIQPVDHHAPILLLLGRDILSVHKVREQINGPSNAPYAQRLDLGVRESVSHTNHPENPAQTAEPPVLLDLPEKQVHFLAKRWNCFGARQHYPTLDSGGRRSGRFPVGRVTFGPVASVVEEREREREKERKREKERERKREREREREREARPIQLQKANVRTVGEAEPAAASSAGVKSRISPDKGITADHCAGSSLNKALNGDLCGASGGLALFVFPRGANGHVVGSPSTARRSALTFTPATDKKGETDLDAKCDYDSQALARDAPDRCSSHFDAVAQIRGEAFFFKGKYFWRLTREKHLVSLRPAQIHRFWRGLPNNLDSVDAVYERPLDHKIVFFKGLKYWVFKDNIVEEGYPRPITDFGLPTDGVDAAFVWLHNDKTYFFKDNLFWRYDDHLRRMDLGYPKDRSSYFFKGKEYWRVPSSDMEAEAAFPRLIAKDWLLCTEMQADSPDSPEPKSPESRGHPDHAQNGYEVCSCTSDGASPVGRRAQATPLCLLLLLLWTLCRALASHLL
ncbi:hypothetical protein WMY93_021559 [Mugilogobius chulae]|uniref:Uncharacterized protein n=1 Tax=Mugilogobius chulae TaxID=88201 RepID=A0AAW0NFP0_9GOBI